MIPTLRLLLVCLAVVSTGCLVGCSDNGSNQDSLPSLPQSNDLRLQPISTSLSSSIFMTAPANDTGRLFIVEQGGLIRIFDVTTSSLLATPFLDISGLISAGGEEGLLGMAFDPQYAVNRRFYIYYTNTAGNIVIARYLRAATSANLADSSSATPLLTVPHPTFSNHNGGMLAFGPDGCLYAGTGDGGGGGDPSNNGQNPSSLLGKLLRLDPDTGGACSNVIINPFVLGGGAQQVWSLGLRNPWRFSFDRQTGDLYIG
ncbi:MAG: PQQ-dependent sugar dehydrogenase, partial [Nitrospira sp.]|nr:PQQ-dependent sugar dehydrogenase [Nitrospira sp.]